MYFPIYTIPNFYDDPDKIREYALSLNYQPPENHGAVGYRCESGRKIEDGTKELFEKLLHSNIPNGNCVGSGREYGHTGHLHHTTIADNSTTITMRKYDATAVSNAYLHGSITYTTD